MQALIDCSVSTHVFIGVVEAWCLEPTRKSPWNSTWLLYLKGIFALPTARNSNEVARAR